MNVVDTISTLNKLGFTKAGQKAARVVERQRKLAIAYEHYRFVRQEKIHAFNEKLKRQTIKGQEPFNATWKNLSFTPIADYAEIPPKHVLDSLETAMGRVCFDSFEIAHIVQVSDPILFGRIEGCPDRFFIDQWDTDVTIDQLINPREG